MENREAIEVLRDLLDTTREYPHLDGMTMFGDAIDLAISALKKQEQDGWIPVTERLPEDDTEVFVYLFDSKSPYIAWICDGRWYTEEFEIEKEHEPVAWRPLPEPYTEEES